MLLNASLDAACHLAHSHGLGMDRPSSKYLMQDRQHTHSRGFTCVHRKGTASCLPPAAGTPTASYLRRCRATDIAWLKMAALAADAPAIRLRIASKILLYLHFVRASGELRFAGAQVLRQARVQDSYTVGTATRSVGCTALMSSSSVFGLSAKARPPPADMRECSSTVWP